MKKDPGYAIDIKIIRRFCIAPLVPKETPFNNQKFSDLRHVKYQHTDPEGRETPRTVLIIGTLYSEGQVVAGRRPNASPKSQKPKIQTESWYTLVLDPFHSDNPIWLIRDLLAYGWRWDDQEEDERKVDMRLRRPNENDMEDISARNFFDRLYNDKRQMGSDYIQPYDQPSRGFDVIKLSPSLEEWTAASPAIVYDALFDKKNRMSLGPRLYPAPLTVLPKD